MNKEKLVCIKNTTTNQHLRGGQSKANTLLKQGFVYISKQEFKNFINNHVQK